MMKRIFLIIAFWAAGVAGASAQMRLTLPQALDLALSENPTVKVAEMEVQRYDYVKRQTCALPIWISTRWIWAA